MPPLRTLVATAAVALLSAPVAAQQVTMMTGPQGGSWVPLGGALKGMWEQAIPGLAIQQQPGGALAHLVSGLLDDGEKRVDEVSDGQIVEGDQGDVFGHPQPRAA